MRALGYTLIFVPLVLLVLGRQVDRDYILPAAFFVAMPLLRLVFGSVPDGGIRDWTGGERRFLKWVPRLYLPAFLGAIAWALWTVHSDEGLRGSVLPQILFGLSLLVMTGLATTVAHELSHRSSRWDKRAAMLISAVAGYPFFIYEHWAHHVHPRDQEAGHCPRKDEGVWAYVARRWILAPKHALSFSRELRSTGRTTALDDQRLYVATTLVVGVGLVAAGGVYGAALFTTLVAGVPLLLNVITYIQHWGLGADGPAEAKMIKQIGWDETSRLQSWLILGISFHKVHHDSPNRPFYECGPTPGAPRLPADYALMFMVCCFPPLWRTVMRPVLNAWATKARHTRQQMSDGQAAASTS